jgi:peptidoglycan/xylan/chitin deacetylase (PgdA/CDA1 family)
MNPIPGKIAIRTLLAASLLSMSSSLFAQAPPHRSIAITIDDLPASSSSYMSAQDVLAMTAKLLGTLHEQKIPAVGFVNEGKLYKTGEVDDHIRALNLWLENGLELGNHTFAHTSLNRVPLQDWEEEVVRGETVTRMLLTQHKMHLRYFRHPFLDTGRDLQTRREAEAFLSGRGYEIAPVTMDAWDWMYAGLYDDAKKRGDSSLQQKLVASYLEHTTAIFDFYEKACKDLFGYEPSQILLLHGNWLEAEHVGEVLELLRQRGYRFVSLEDALSDGAYSSPDEYVGGGTGWIDHWAITRGRPLPNSPQVPRWVLESSNKLRQQLGMPATPSPY